MKKIRIFSILMALVLTLQCVYLPVWAEEDETVGNTEETVEETVPETQFAIPENITGDASVSMGGNSVDALYPLFDTVDYEPTGTAALVYELNTDTLMYAYQPDDRMYPASMTKVMTCLLALELCEDLSETVTVTSSAIAQIDWTSSAAGLVAGEELTMEQLLYCLMVKSANDAACVIAEHLAGSQVAFVELMNARAGELGCENTNFVNVHGLHDENHYTTARDMAKIMMAALEHELFNTLYSTVTYELAATNKSDEPRVFTTTNYMIDESRTRYYDSRVIGGKTGFTTPAGRCLTAVSESDGMKLLTVVMGTKTEYYSDGWTVKRYGSFEETQSLMDLVYNNCMSTMAVSANQILTQFQVSGGETATQGYVKESVAVTLPADGDLRYLQYEYVLNDGILEAPVEQDECIGYVRVWYRDMCVAQVEMYSTLSVAKAENSAVKVLSSMTRDSSGLWQIVLTVILVLAALIAVMLIIGRIRAAVARAKRRKRHKARRSSRTQSHGRSR